MGLSSKLFWVLWSIPTLVGIIRKGCSCECGIRVHMVSIDWNIFNKYFCDIYGSCEIVEAG